MNPATATCSPAAPTIFPDGRATTASSKVVYSLQLLRAAAAILVLIRHASKYAFAHDPARAFEVGQFGVDIFFIISGIVIFLTGRSLTWDRFLRRRIARIVPLYWLALSAALVASLAGPRNDYWATNAVLSYFFIPAHESPTAIFPPIVAGWTLNFEMYFYLVCTFCLWLFPRRWFSLCVGLIIGCGILAGIPLLWPLLQGDGELIHPAFLVLLLPITAEFLAGLALGHLRDTGFRTPLWFNLALLVGACVWLIQVPGAQPYTLARPLYWGVPALFIVWAFLSAEEQLPFHRWRTGLLLGDASYAIYLTHPIVLSVGDKLAGRLGLDLPVPAYLLGSVGTCLIVGVLCHKLVEKPLVRIANKLLRLGGRNRVSAVA